MGDLPAWVQWVPAAAIVGAMGAYGIREFEAWRARKRELKGLLRLLAVEITYNEAVFELFVEAPTAVGELAEGAGLQARAWEENRTRIAQLIKDSDDLQVLADYFMNVAVFEKERLDPDKREGMHLYTSQIQEQGKDALAAVIRIVGAKVQPQVEGPIRQASEATGD